MLTIAIRACLLASGLLVLVACGGGQSTNGSADGSQQPASKASRGAAEATTIATAPATGSIEARLGIDEPAAKAASVEALVSGSSYGLIAPIVRGFKQLPANERGDAIRSLALCLQAFFQSPEFTTMYAVVRDQAKPTPPTYEQTIDEVQQAWIADSKDQIEKTRKETLPMLPAESRPEVEKSLEQSEAMFSDPQMLEYHRQAIEAERASDAQGYERSLASWQTTYPEDPKGLVKQRLNEFIALASSVDFGAELVEKDGMKHFAKPEYEAKSGDWKMCYRAGKNSVDAAREVATQWLSETE